MRLNLISDGLPGPEHRDDDGNCWWGQHETVRNGQWHAPCWYYGREPDHLDAYWVAYDALPLPPDPNPEEPEEQPDPEDDWRTHPSLTAAERNPSMCVR
jgi:hypothetical protein